MKQAPVLTERDVKRVLQPCAQTACPDRNRLVFQLGNLSGMRIGEISALKISDVLSEDGAMRTVIQLTAAQTKGCEARTVRVSTQLQTELAAYLRTLSAERRAADLPLITNKLVAAFSANGLCQLMLKL